MASKAAPPTAAAPATAFHCLGPSGHYEVVHDKVMIRASPSTKAAIVNIVKKGDTFKCVPFAIDGIQWLRVDEESLEEHHILVPKGVDGCWLLPHGKSVGLGELLRRVADPFAPPARGKPEAQLATLKKAPAKPPEEDEDEPVPLVVGPAGEYVVNHDRVVVRAKPRINAGPVMVHKMSDLLVGTPCDVEGKPWLRLDAGWMLMDGRSVGLGQLLVPAADIAEDLVLWAEQHHASAVAAWTAETKAELDQLVSMVEKQTEVLPSVCQHRDVAKRFAQAGFIEDKDLTLGPDSISKLIMRKLLRHRASGKIGSEQAEEGVLPCSVEAFEEFLDTEIAPLNPFHCRIVAPEEQPQRVLLLLHGSWVRGDDLVADAEALQKLLPLTAVVLPEAPVLVDAAHELRAWWAEQTATAPSSTLQRLQATIRWAQARHRGVPFLLGGFSQGAMLASQCLSGLPAENLPKGVLILSGLVATFELPASVQCLAIHGSEDSKIGIDVARAASEQMKRTALTWEEVPGLAHEISDAVIDRIVKFADASVPIKGALAVRDEASWQQEAQQAKLLRWIKKIAQVITMFDDVCFMSHIMVLDMIGLGDDAPTLGGGLLRYRLHDVGPNCQGLVVLFHGKVRDLDKQTAALVQAYRGLRMSVCVVDYRQKFSQFCVDATVVLEELENIMGGASHPVIIHAIGCGGIHGLHMAIASHTFPSAIRRTLRLLVLDGAVANFRSLPPSPTGCIATDPIGNDAKLKYIGLPVCILGGDDPCCGYERSAGHYTVLTKAAEIMLEEKLLPAVVTSMGTALMTTDGAPRLCPELYEAVETALRTQREECSQASKLFSNDVLLSRDLAEAAEIVDISAADLERLCDRVVQAASSDGASVQLWKLRAMMEPRRGEELTKLVIACHATPLKEHGGFKAGPDGFRQFESTVAAMSMEHQKLAAAHEKLREAFSLRRLDQLVLQANRHRPEGCRGTLEQCHEVLDNAVLEWHSDEMWDKALQRLKDAGGARPGVMGRLVKELSESLNVSHGRNLGFQGSDGEVNEQLGKMFAHFCQCDPSLHAKTHDIHEAVRHFLGKMTQFASSQPELAGKDRKPVGNAAAPAAVDITLMVEHLVEGSTMSVVAASTASVLDVRRLIMTELGEMRLSQVKLVTRSDSGEGYELMPDELKINGSRSLLMVGRSLKGQFEEEPQAAATNGDSHAEAAPQAVAAGGDNGGDVLEEDMEIVIHIDRLLDMKSAVPVKAGATVLDIKQLLADADPTGATKPGDMGLKLCDSGEVLPDDALITVSMLQAELELCFP